MIVKLHLHSLLQRPSPTGLIRQLEVELAPGVTLEELLTLEGIIVDPEHCLLVVNSRNVELDHVLNDGDEVDLIPAISGGSGMNEAAERDVSQIQRAAPFLAKEEQQP